MPGWSVSSLSASLSPSPSHDPFKRIYEQQIKGIHNDVPLFCRDSSVAETSSPSLSTHTHMHTPVFKQVSWLISDTHMEWQRDGTKIECWSSLFEWKGLTPLVQFILEVGASKVRSEKGKKKHLFLVSLSSHWLVKLPGWFYSWLSITCLVKNRNTSSLLIINQWSIKQAICPIRA